ncbi:hypothetical protein HOG31_05440 [archaeon]|mgnify:FL=1|jgi:hypothetical protein|nr:hypothetical protein [archaeon]MBT3731409.1 hypothetical protein [archaeon]MBT4670288.1 hypothetical protein [archaeon]MBT7052454.1 hypothetical protein [archaeon]
MALYDLIPTTLIMPIMVGVIIAIIVISYKLGIIQILFKIIFFPITLIWELLGLSKDASSVSSYSEKSSKSLLSSLVEAFERDKVEEDLENLEGPQDQKIGKETGEAEQLSSDLEQELAKDTAADPDKINNFKESLRTTLDSLTSEIKQEDQNFTLLKKQYLYDLKLSRKSIKVTRKQLSGEKIEEKFIGESLETLKGSEYENTNMLGDLNQIIGKIKKSEEEISAQSNKISAISKVLIQNSSQRQTLSHDILKLSEKANKLINDEITEENVGTVRSILEEIRNKRKALSSFRKNIQKFDVEKELVLKNLITISSNAVGFIQNQKDIVGKLSSLVQSVKAAKEKMEKAKSAA